MTIGIFSPLPAVIVKPVLGRTPGPAAISNTAGTTHTFSVDIPAGERVLVGAHGRSTSSISINSVTVDGVAASIIASYNHPAIDSAYGPLAFAVVNSTGPGTKTVTVGFSASSLTAGVALWGLDGLLSTTPLDTKTASGNSATGSLTLTSALGGAVFAVSRGANGTIAFHAGASAPADGALAIGWTRGAGMTWTGVTSDSLASYASTANGYSTVLAIALR